MVRYPSLGTSNLAKSRSKRGLRANASYRRKSGGREPRPVILIVCEGEKTEPNYFKAIKHSRRVNAEVIIVPRKIQPKDIIKSAEQEKLSYREYEQIWCVFDCDERPDFELSITSAKEKGFKVAYSNPCIELWYLLHYQTQNAHITKKVVDRKLKSHLPNYSKSRPIYEELQHLETQAFENADAQEKHHVNSGRQKTCNPSTTVHKLVEYLNSLSTC
jgi:hypothetical protein